MGQLTAAAAKLSSQLWADAPPDDATVALLLEQFVDGAKAGGVTVEEAVAEALLAALRKGEK
jgi:hypothetical protein